MTQADIGDGSSGVPCRACLKVDQYAGRLLGFSDWSSVAAIRCHIIANEQSCGRCRAEMEQQEDMSRHDLAAKRGRAQQELDSRFGDAFGPKRQMPQDKCSRH